MKTRINTTITKEVLDRAKIRAVQEGVRLNEVIEKALEEYLKEEMKMEITLNWVTHDHDLKALEVIDMDTGETICKVYPNTIEEMEEMKAEIMLYGVDTVRDWEDGNGNQVETLISEYEERV